jgi:hypothetical protein
MQYLQRQGPNYRRYRSHRSVELAPLGVAGIVILRQGLHARSLWDAFGDQ